LTAVTEDEDEDEDESDELLGADDEETLDGDEDCGEEVLVVELELFTITLPALAALDELEDVITGAVEDDVRGTEVVGSGAGESEAAED